MKSQPKASGARPVSEFSQRVLRIALTIPRGMIVTYGAISRASGGGAMASQSITAVLGKWERTGVKNIPFHRIVYAGGRVWYNDEYKTERVRMLKEEGIVVDGKGRIKNFGDIVWEPN